MKKTNKIIALFAAMVMVLSIAAGCGSKVGDAAGTWNMTSMSYADTDMPMDGIGITIALELNTDGSMKLTTSTPMVSSEGVSRTGTWEQNGNKVSITLTGETMDGEVSGNTLTLGTDDAKVTFERQ